MDGKMLARTALIIVLALAMTAEAIHRVREDLSAAIPPAAARAEAPRPSALGDALKHCQQMGEAATRDADCLPTWDENRRRFLSPAGAK
jgi:conjugative transfer region protein TrbK